MSQQMAEDEAKSTKQTFSTSSGEKWIKA